MVILEAEKARHLSVSVPEDGRSPLQCARKAPRGHIVFIVPEQGRQSHQIIVTFRQRGDLLEKVREVLSGVAQHKLAIPAVRCAAKAILFDMLETTAA